MKPTKWYATYSRWRQTHNEEHVEYENRKAYPWHVLSKFNFDPNELPSSTATFSAPETGTCLGSITVIDHQHRTHDRRHQFDIALDDSVNGTHWQFRLVFSAEGTLITVHKRGSDINSAIGVSYIQKGPGVLDQEPSARVLKTCFHEIVLVALGQLLEEGYDSDVHVYVPWTKNGVLRKSPKRLLLNFSGPDNHWVLFRPEKQQAQSLGRRLNERTNPITILYSIPSDHSSSTEQQTVQVVQLSAYEKTIMSSQLKRRYEDLKKIYEESQKNV